MGSSHSLEIERGRYVGRPEHERLCSVCNVIEDEFHVVMFCPLYDELRNSFFNRVIDMFPFLSLYSTYDQFLFFMGFNDKNLHWLFSRNIRDQVWSGGCPADSRKRAALCRALFGLSLTSSICFSLLLLFSIFIFFQ